MIKKACYLLVLVCFCLSVPAMGQSREEKKMQRLYHQKKYAECYHYARKLSSKERLQQWAAPYFYEALSLQHLFVSPAGKIDKDILKASLVAAKQGKQYDHQQEYFTVGHLYYDSLLFYYHHLVRNLMYSNHKTEAKATTVLLATVLCDTTAFYPVFFPSKTIAGRTTETPVLYESTAPLLTWADSLVEHACRYQQGMQYKASERFIHEAYARMGIVLPQTWEDVKEQGIKITLGTMQKGDLIFWGKDDVRHVAMYISEPGQMPRIIHNPYGNIVVELFTPESWWRLQRVHTVVRIPVQRYSEEAGALLR